MQHLTREEIKRLLAEIPVARQKLLVLVTYLHGFRASESLALTGNDIRDGHINVQRLKGSLRTIQPYVHSDDPDMDEAAHLTALSKTLLPKDKLFPWTRNGMYKLIQRAGLRAGIAKHKLHPHALKHSCAMAAIGTVGIENLRQYLGHKSISSTGEYLRVSDEAASKAVAGVFA